MTLTNTATILRQMNAVGGCGGYFSDELDGQLESIKNGRSKMAEHRKEQALKKYADALIGLGRPATAREIAELTGTTPGAVVLHIKKYPDQFIVTVEKLVGVKRLWIELRK